MASIKDVAARAEVSTATVSRVLTNHPNVRPAVRERVLAAIAALEYRPNLVARTLRSQQSQTIGLIVSDIRNPFFTAVSRAIEDRATALGYSVILCNSDEDPHKETHYLSLMRDTNVAGVIFSPTRETLFRLPELAIDFPIIIIDRSDRAVSADMVLLDNIEAGYTLTCHLLQQGYRTIAGLFGSASTTGRERRTGYEHALADHGLSARPEHVQMLPPTVEDGLRATRALLALPQPPDAILTSNSMLLSGALHAIRERQVRIPHDVALAGFDDATWTTLVEPPLTVIAQPTEEIGYTATDLLVQRIREPDRPTRRVILAGLLMTRGSTARKDGTHPALIARVRS